MACCPTIMGGTNEKGPYVPAPYLSPKTFAPFAVIQKSHGFVPNFFRAQTLRPDLLEAQLEAMGRILLPEDAPDTSAKGMHSASRVGSEPQLLLRCDALQPFARLGHAPQRTATKLPWTIMSPTCRNPIRALLDFRCQIGDAWIRAISREDVVNLRTLGFTEEQILECEVVTALNNFSNTLQMGLGIEPEFEPPAVFQENNVHLSYSHSKQSK
jgi:hypothetical protein